MNKELIEKISKHAYSFIDTLYHSQATVEHILENKVKGAIVECGVAGGAQIMAMQAVLVEKGEFRPIYAYDSFQGVPLAGPNDKDQPGIGVITHDVNLSLRDRLKSSGQAVHGVDSVKSTFTEYGLPLHNVEFVVGWFQDTMPLNKIGKIAILRLDGDLYESTYVCLEHLFPKVVIGGIVIIDDYALPGARKALEDYVNANQIIAELAKVTPEENGVHYFVKVNGMVYEEPKVIKNHSQNNEQEIIRGYFGGRKGVLLDIGANDGITFSNTHALMLDNWDGILLEPSPKAFERLTTLYADNNKAACLKIGIGVRTEEVEFWESGAFNHTGPDVALVSCVDPKEKQRWGDTVKFEPIKASLLSFQDFLNMLDNNEVDKKFNFINIDAEGMDYEILKQINLKEIGCECFCIEHNSVQDVINKYRSVSDYFGFREIGFNAENLIFAK